MASESPLLGEDLVAGAVALAGALKKYNIEYAVIGGIAAGFHGGPRLTIDIDLIVDIPQVVLPKLLDDLSEHGFSLNQEDVIRQWIEHHITQIKYKHVRVDWLKPILPCYRFVVKTAVERNWLGTMFRFATAEAIIVTKLISFRTQDRADIENLLAANRGQLDLDSIRLQWESFVDIFKGRLELFEQMVDDFYNRPVENPGE